MHLKYISMHTGEGIPGRGSVLNLEIISVIHLIQVVIDTSVICSSLIMSMNKSATLGACIVICTLV